MHIPSDEDTLGQYVRSRHSYDIEQFLDCSNVLSLLVFQVFLAERTKPWTYKRDQSTQQPWKGQCFSGWEKDNVSTFGRRQYAYLITCIWIRLNLVRPKFNRSRHSRNQSCFGCFCSCVWCQTTALKLKWDLDMVSRSASSSVWQSDNSAKKFRRRSELEWIPVSF